MGGSCLESKLRVLLHLLEVSVVELSLVDLLVTILALIMIARCIYLFEELRSLFCNVIFWQTLQT